MVTATVVIVELKRESGRGEGGAERGGAGETHATSAGEKSGIVIGKELVETSDEEEVGVSSIISGARQ